MLRKSMLPATKKVWVVLPNGAGLQNNANLPVLIYENINVSDQNNRSQYFQMTLDIFSVLGISFTIPAIKVRNDSPFRLFDMLSDSQLDKVQVSYLAGDSSESLWGLLTLIEAVCFQEDNIKNVSDKAGNYVINNLKNMTTSSILIDTRSDENNFKLWFDEWKSLRNIEQIINMLEILGQTSFYSQPSFLIISHTKRFFIINQLRILLSDMTGLSQQTVEASYKQYMDVLRSQRPLPIPGTIKFTLPLESAKLG